MDFQWLNSKSGFLVRPLRVSLQKPNTITQKRSEIISHGFRIFADVLGLLSTDTVTGQERKGSSPWDYILRIHFVLDEPDQRSNKQARGKVYDIPSDTAGGPMRLVNIKERMPTEEDADHSGDVVWIAICTTYTRTGIEKRFHHSAHNSWTEHGFESFRDQVGFGVDSDEPGDDEIFWLEVNPQPALPEVKSHIRKVEL